MRRVYRRILAVTVAVAVIGVSACGDDDESGENGRSGDTQVEVFSWWTGAGEEEGLAAMVEDFKKKNPGIDFVNAAVAGGGGTQARQVLASRLKGNNPPDSYQVHAGKELASDIAAGEVTDLTGLYSEQGWNEKFPAGLLDLIKQEGKIYSVPVNIHRSNVLWYVPAKLKAAGIEAPPKTWSEFISQAAALRAKKIIPLSVGPSWAQLHVMENVLLGELGAEKYTGLWDGSTDWKSAEVIAALAVFKKVMSYSDIAAPSADWQPALDKVLSGKAAYNVMGDWADGYLKGTKQLTFKEGYNAVLSPGTEGVFNFLSDSFTLSVGAPHPDAAKKWLIECGSVDGQDLFNPLKGSVPARTDADASKYTDYLATALADWQNTSTAIVGSLAHGAVANNAWKAEIERAFGQYVKDWDSAKFADSVAKSYQSSGK